MELVVYIIFAMLGGLILSRVVKLVNVPNVTGYLIAGLLLGPFFLNLIKTEDHQALSVITAIALGFIAFSIGSEFKISNLKQIGSKVLIITVVQAFAAVFFVMAALFVVRLVSPSLVNVPVILLLGAIAAATAPAATLMVVRQYKAKGPLTDTLLPVVAGDDAVGLFIFSLCITLARVFMTGNQITFSSIILEPLREIGLSLLTGAVIGAVLVLSMKLFMSRANRLSLMVVSVFSCVVLSERFGLSPLLTCMMLGAVFANMRSDAHVILEGCDRWTPPVFMLFFVISGTELDLKILPLVGVIGIVYIVSRSAGKYLGCFMGAKLVRAEPNITKYLGVAMLPQAGVAIGMAQMIAADPGLTEIAPQIVTVVLSATLIYEMVGPLLTKMALTKAGEIEKKPAVPHTP